MSESPIVVIGAGIGGLSAAIRLASEGRRVIVIEKNHRWVVRWANYVRVVIGLIQVPL